MYNYYVLTCSITTRSVFIFLSPDMALVFFHSYACHIFAPMSLLYSNNVTFPHYTKSNAAGSSQIEFPSRAVEGQELLFLITNASGDVVTYQLKEQLGHQVASLLQTSSPKTKCTSCQSARQTECAYKLHHSSVFFYLVFGFYTEI